ncbi:hypothetical protein CSAL01_08139 [Colletotrichum salicis]|uniref:Uncharacterized protein n=1 Tax=Colletotrichum salicis TaxID=1209931 RepID=A0A135UU60_9PEZI|nr:hypothetical protein CSAL01_08139 [Colletotrichum salicis]
MFAWTSRKASRTLVRPTNIAVLPQAGIPDPAAEHSPNSEHPSSRVRSHKSRTHNILVTPHRTPPAVHTPTPLPANMLNAHGTSAGEYDVVGRLGVDR